MFGIPRYMGETIADVVKFLTNYAQQLPKYAAALGLDAATVQYVKDGTAMFLWLENTHLTETNDAKIGATDARDNFAGDKDPTPFVPPTPVFTPAPATATPINDGFVVLYLDTQVKQIRLTKAYKDDPNIGTNLGIAERAGITGAPPAKASIKGVEGLPGFAMQVKANKYGAKSVLFYDMADPSNPVLLSAQSSAIFVDDRAPTIPGQSEMRSYAVRYGDSQNKPLPDSLMSDIINAPTHP